MQFDHRLDQCQAKACALVLPIIRTVDLHEGIEDQIEIFRADSDTAVFNGNRQTPRINSKTHVDMSATRRELNGIADEVHNNLPELAFISAQQRQIRHSMNSGYQAGAGNTLGKQSNNTADDLGRIEVIFIQLQLAGFSLAQVKDIVDQS